MPPSHCTSSHNTSSPCTSSHRTSSCISTDSYIISCNLHQVASRGTNIDRRGYYISVVKTSRSYSLLRSGSLQGEHSSDSIDFEQFLPVNKFFVKVTVYRFALELLNSLFKDEFPMGNHSLMDIINLKQLSKLFYIEWLAMKRQNYSTVTCSE